MNEHTEKKITQSELTLKELILYFREKCKVCGHHRIMHNEYGKCDGVMNKPCNSGCDRFILE